MNTIKIFFAGDFCSRPTTSFISVSDELRELIQTCDLRVVNFEVPLKQDGADLPSYSRKRYFQNDDTPQFLKDLGFDLFAGANNHALDQGVEGYLKTRNALGDALFGSGTYDEAYKIKVVECNGLKIGLMALCYAAHLGIFDKLSNRSGYGCAYIDDLRVNHDIIRAKENVDYLFVLPHAGIEYIDVPLPDIIARYRDFVDYGADGVIGTHPHCPQGWEEYKGKPIFYSLGNFFFNSKDDVNYRAIEPHWYEGMCVKMTIADNGISWQPIHVRNKNNIELFVDHDKSREEHLAYCNHLLSDKEDYYTYLNPILNEQIVSYREKFKRLFAPISFKDCAKAYILGKKTHARKRLEMDNQDFYSFLSALQKRMNNLR